MPNCISLFAQLQDDTGTSAITIVTQLAVFVFGIAAMWKTFVKAGEPGWAAIIPIYNVIVILRIAGKPWWWIFLLLIPLVNIVILILVSIDVAKNFGHGVGFGIGLALLAVIFYGILGFGDSQFRRVV
jgi:hypothetical protein